MNEIGPRAAPAAIATQPVPATDRRVLSEAWYRALYAGREKPAPNLAGAHRGADGTRRDAGGAQTAQRPHAPRAGVHAEAAGQAARRRLVRAAIGVSSRVLALKRKTAAAGIRVACRNGAFARTICRAKLVDGAAVDLLMEQRGDVLRLVAIYDGRSAARVAAALNRARTALTLRGVRTQLDAIQKGSS